MRFASAFILLTLPLYGCDAGDDRAAFEDSASRPGESHQTGQIPLGAGHPTGQTALGEAPGDPADMPSFRVTVAAGAFDRTASIAEFALPDGGLPAPFYRLRDEQGRETPVQAGPDGRLWFVVDGMPAGTTQSFLLEPDADTPASVVDARIVNGSVRMHLRDHHLLTYHARETEPPRDDIAPIYRRGGYIHPVHSPSGVLLTGDYPPDHVHHHGIWAAWTNTRYGDRTPDFWNMGAGTGTVEPVDLERAWSGPVHAGVRARHRYVDLSGPEPETVLYETWDVYAFALTGRPYHVFDLDLRQDLAGETTLHLPEYRYGGVGFRGHDQWNGEENAFFLTSEGRDRSDGHATRARWCHIGGYVDGNLAGVAILDHPANFEAPQPMRIHPDEPFFNYAPVQAGDFAIRPGEEYRARYRYVVHDGEPDPELIDRLWNDFAHPPVVTLDPL